MKIHEPLQGSGALLNDDNKKRWDGLSVCEKLFYKYAIEHDASLSSVLLGIFTAYVVNLMSNLLTLKITDLFFGVAYIFNMIFAIRVLYFLVKLYRIHVMLEKQSENNAISIRANKDFEVLYKEYSRVAQNIKLFKKNALGLCIMFLLCFVLNNDNGFMEIMRPVVAYLWEFLGRGY